MGLALALIAGAALAQDATVKKPRRPQPPPAASNQPSPADGGPASAASGLRGPEGLAPSPTVPGDGATLTTASPPVLRSAVRPRWSSPATIASRGGGACRSQCAASRIACLAPQGADDAPRCDAEWTRCLSTCDGLTYGRAPSSSP